MILRCFEEIDDFNFLICLDTEWTCWEDSFKLGWPDPKFPPEIIQIGLAVYDIPAFSLLNTFVSYVSPKVNPVLSEYCTTLLPLTQSDIDQASCFCEVSGDVTAFLAPYLPQLSLICSFGQDCEYVAADANRHLVDNPLSAFSDMDVRCEFSRIFDIPIRKITREFIMKKLNLVEAVGRHDALFDAHQVCELIRGVRDFSNNKF